MSDLLQLIVNSTILPYMIRTFLQFKTLIFVLCGSFLLGGCSSVPPSKELIWQKEGGAENQKKRLPSKLYIIEKSKNRLFIFEDKVSLNKYLARPSTLFRHTYISAGPGHQDLIFIRRLKSHYNDKTDYYENVQTPAEYLMLNLKDIQEKLPIVIYKNKKIKVNIDSTKKLYQYLAKRKGADKFSVEGYEYESQELASGSKEGRGLKESSFLNHDKSEEMLESKRVDKNEIIIKPKYHNKFSSSLSNASQAIINIGKIKSKKGTKGSKRGHKKEIGSRLFLYLKHLHIDDKEADFISKNYTKTLRKIPSVLRRKYTVILYSGALGQATSGYTRVRSALRSKELEKTYFIVDLRLKKFYVMWGYGDASSPLRVRIAQLPPKLLLVRPYVSSTQKIENILNSNKFILDNSGL